MLRKKIPHIILALLVGLMISCGSSNPFTDEAQTNIESQNFKGALESAEKSIKNRPGDPLGYYYKGVALGEIAGEMEDPSERTDFYKRMNEAFATAKSIADTSESVPDEIDRIPSVVNVIWQTEHNRAVQLATDDSLMNAVDNNIQKSVQHLQNATIIQPDSTLSWNVLASVAGMNSDWKLAIDAKEKYISMTPDTSVTKKDYLSLAQYYYQTDDQQGVLGVLTKAKKQFPTDEQIVSNLADTYTRLGKPDKAIETVQELVNQNPENPQYRLSLGTQIYQKALKLRDSVNANQKQIRSFQQKLQKASGSETQNIKQQISSLEQENQELQTQVEDLTNRAEKQLNTALEYRPDDDAAYNVLGAIYQNRAQEVWDQRNRTTDNEKAAKLDKQGREYLKQAMKYYEQATKIAPDNTQYWRSLFQIYTALGMDEKAKEAMKKAGMQ